MRSCFFALPKWRWFVSAYLECGPEDLSQVMRELEICGCPPKTRRRVEDVVFGRADDTGATYSNYAARESVLIVGRTSSASQFANSYDHEKGHLARHICQACGIDPFGEEAEYLAGEIAQKLFPTAEKFLCDRCRKG